MRRPTWLLLTILGLGGLGVGFGGALEPDSRAPRRKAAKVEAPIGSIPHESSIPLAPRPTIDTEPAESAVADFRRRTLSPEPRQQPSALLAISGARVARIEADTLVVVEPGTKKERLTHRLPGAFAVAATPTAILAAGQDHLLVLGPGEHTPKSMPRPTMFAGSQLMPDLIDDTRVWVRHPRENSLFGYALGPPTSPFLPLVDTVPLSGAANGTFLGLADGSFLHFTGTAWERLFLKGSRSELPWPSSKAPPARMLRAHRIDQVYMLSPEGELELYQLQVPLLRLWQRNIAPLPVDIATSGDTVFLLRAGRNAAQELDWTLQVIHPRREDVFIPLGATGDPDDFRGDWYGRLLARFALATSSRWVALGGTGQLRVWDAKSLEPIAVRQ